MDIQSEIEAWDNKSAADIRNIYERHYHGASFVPTIIQFTVCRRLQKGAAWLLKHHLEHDNNLDQLNVIKLFENLNQLEHWEAKLLILQCLPFLSIPTSQKNSVEIFLRNCLMDDNKFVRAWAYNGWYELSVQYPQYKNETKQFFDMAMHDEAPSVKARIRNIIKKGF